MALNDETGFDQVGQVETFDRLRSIRPDRSGQRILLRSYLKDKNLGDGEFVGTIAAGVDDKGFIAAGDGFY
ncbi:hypothetical protein [Serratia entomophila]|uniref:Uncharacterized protein n=1 Tax=Serratia entomophila TaxID=42906 RepID=A0ABY5CVD7_9GAMM|nr:hypothetical protein [Serratia entomophila]UIW19511.1 hypothetical protein KHA73_06055 [Serratia entomophila]USV02036.1 hypothetical protein KFQ06_05805 [Serratia entomophila]